MIKEPQAGQVVPVGYPVPRRAVLAGTVAAGVLAWARKPAGLAAAKTKADVGWSGGPANVRVSRDAFTMHAEPSLAANPADPRNLLAACMVWRAGRRGLATYASFDEGSTWHGNGLLPGVTPAYDADVTVAFDHQGTGYVSGSAARRAHEQRGRACLWRTADGGRSFAAPVTVATGLLDHPSLAADRWARRGPATLFVAGDYFRGGLAFTRSTDGGRSFEPLRFPDPGSDPHGGLAPMMSRPGRPGRHRLLRGTTRCHPADQGRHHRRPQPDPTARITVRPRPRWLSWTFRSRPRRCTPAGRPAITCWRWPRPAASAGAALPSRRDIT